MAPFNGRLSHTVMVVGLVVVAAALSGCGRRGPLEAPPSATAVQPADTGTVPDTSAPAKPNKPFLLDPLIK